jgi:hypothetical protein
MNPYSSKEVATSLAAFPPGLRELIDAELAAGNTIEEIASVHPAPPAGAYVKLARLVTTRPRETNGEITFYERSSSSHSGEWTDARRFFWVLEPAGPPPPEPDMDAIRRQLNGPSVVPNEQAAPRVTSDDTVSRFAASMVIDYDKWHDGVGYDLTILDAASPAELKSIERIILSRGVKDWRDAEVLARLGTDRARAELREAFAHGTVEIRGAVMRYAPELVSAAKKTAHLIDALRNAEFYYGLSEALGEVEDFHPPKIMDELFRATLRREGGVAVHFAGMLLFLHGQSKMAFDWEHRPFLLRFGTSNRAEREAVFRELCERIKVDPSLYLKS